MNSTETMSQCDSQPGGEHFRPPHQGLGENVNVHSNQARRTVPRWADLPFMRTIRGYFLLGHNPRVVGCPRRRLVHSCGAKRPCDWRDWTASDEHFAIVHVNDGLEFDYAAQHL
jgi:hypothetical protein